MAEASVPVHVVRPSRGWTPPHFRELWEYRELLYFLIWRDIKVRYKQTSIGAAWAVLQPFLTMVVFSVVFGRLAKMPSEGIPYPIFTFTALLPWQFFAKALTDAGNSIVLNQRLVTKVYFPRILVPAAVVLSGLLDFGIAFLMLMTMMFYYGLAITWTALLLPLFLILATVTALGASFWLSALDVEYRDVKYALPFLTQVWLFVTPVVYSSSLIPLAWRDLYGVNPMAAVVEGFRWTLLGSKSPSLPMLVIAASASVLLFVGGLAYFRHVERTMADRI